MALPQILGVEPRNYEVDIDINSSIIITFNTDIDASSLSGQVVKVSEVETSQLVSGRISYRRKVVTFTPTEPLSKGTNYMVTVEGDNNLEDGVNEGVRNILGEYMVGSFSSRFMTDAEGLLPAPIIIAPMNNTVIKETPVYEWEFMEGVSHYEVEISKTNTFATLVFPMSDSNTIFGTAISPNIDYEDGIYYWRVRAARHANDKGAWSPIMQFNLSREERGHIALEDGAFIDATNDVSFTGEMPLELIEVFPKDLESLVPVNVANLYFRMLGDINMNDIDMDSVQLIGKNITGDIEEESHGRVDGKITIVTSGDFTTYIIFTPRVIPEETEEVVL